MIKALFSEKLGNAMLDGLQGEESGYESVGQRQRKEIAINAYLAILQARIEITLKYK